jgi:error-prone DNA polymerase
VSDPFVHLHVASGYSLRYGASHPHVLVERAADHGMDTLALTDRDGCYGAVKFVQACRSAHLRPILGVDLAVRNEGHPHYRGRSVTGPASDRRTPKRKPVRGGAFADAHDGPPGMSLPRVVLLAQNKQGWAAICRLVSATHLAGERGRPITTHDLIKQHAYDDVVLLLGPTSDVGRALAQRRPDLAHAALNQWREVTSDIVIEVVHHRGPAHLSDAARLAGFAADHHIPAVLSNAVRYADRSDAPVTDVLDAARRLVALDLRHIDRVNAEAYLKSGKEMTELAADIARAIGRDDEGRHLLATTRHVADRCAVDPRTDLGIGEIHFPEFEVGGGGDAMTRSGRRHVPPATLLRERCETGFGRRGMPRTDKAVRRLEDELAVIGRLGYPSYFLTVADVTDLIRDMGIRRAARGSGAGSLVNYLLGVSDVDPLEHRLLMERFLSPLRQALPDIDIDVESARRTEVYEAVLEKYGAERCACVAMMDTYRVRHAIRDVGAALGVPVGEIDTIAKAFPHIRASQARAAIRDLPELQASGLAAGGRFDAFFTLVEKLDGLPRHIALHPCGVLLSDHTLLDRTPVEASWLGFPMSQFDKDDVEALGLLKLDLLGIRMQSSIAHALDEIERVDGRRIDIDTIPRDDATTFELIQSTRTLGMFQIESPGQRELVGKFSPESFADIITDISLFRPGPVKSDMVTPFLEARLGWTDEQYLHPDLRDCLEQTSGVVVFHEQVLEMIAVMTGCTLAEADEVRRALGDPDGKEDARVWFHPRAIGRGYSLPVVRRVWQVLEAFASFGFCKAHAAAFAVPTYQSAWLKAHHPAAFLAGVLTHDPGMYPKRLILEDARRFGIAVLPLDVNESDATYRIEKMASYDEPPPAILDSLPEPDVQGRRYGIRLALADVKGINDAEVASVIAGRPYYSLSDFWARARVSRPIAERLVIAGGFDSIYGIGSTFPVRRRGKVTRRDLLLQVTDLDRYRRAVARSSRRNEGHPHNRGRSETGPTSTPDVRELAARQSQAAKPVRVQPVQLALDLGDAPGEVEATGLPEMTTADRVKAELEILGLDVSRHVVEFYAPFLDALGVTRAHELMRCRSRAEILVAGVKVATQTPPIRSGRRVIFLTLDDATGPIDATFFEDAQGPYAATLFHSWLLVVRGVIRRTGKRGISLRATGCWELSVLRDAWEYGGIDAVHAAMQAPAELTEASVQGSAESFASRPVMASPPLKYANGFALSPYADIRPAGTSPKGGRPPGKLWHSSPGSSGG